MAKLYHAEDEAKELWCPMAATTNGDQKCLASGCMAWRDATYKGKSEDNKLGVCGLVRFAPDR